MTVVCEDPAEEISLFALLKPAAYGDLSALRALAIEGRQIAAEMSDPLFCLFEARVFARLAAAQGRPEDWHLCAMIASDLAAACYHQGLTEEAARCEGEALALVSLMADEGCEHSAEILGKLSSLSVPDAACEAKWFEREWRNIHDVR